MLITLLSTQIIWAQVKSSEIVFDSKVFDFGQIDEAAGAVHYTFSFTNNSSIDFALRSVEPSCGCTTPEWSREPVKPGQRGFIKASFNPNGMTGEAFKTIVVKGNFFDQFAVVLEIKGQITSKRFGPQTYYPGQYGYLRFLDNQFDFGTVYHTQKDTNEISFFNEGTDTLKILEFRNVPPYLKLWYDKKPIAPGQTVKIHAELDGSKLMEWGGVNENMIIVTNDRFFDLKEANISAYMADDFSKMSKKDLKNAPKITFDKTSVDLGTFKTGGKRTGTLSITNTGKSPLIIHKTHTICSCTILGGLKDQLEAGETITLSVEFDAVFKVGRQMKAVTFFTNDPSNPVSQVVVIAQILEHQ